MKKRASNNVNIARIVKAALHKLPGKSSLNVRSVCTGFPACPDDHDDHDEHTTMIIITMTSMTTNFALSLSGNKDNKKNCAKYFKV